VTSRLGLAALLVVVVGCAASTPVGSDDGALTVDTSTPEARRQYDANLAFARGYEARCGSLAGSSRPRVLVTGFGRFSNFETNASGRIVSALVPDATYPLTEPPAPGEVDPPEPQLSVATASLRLPDVGAVDVCAMILPVSWDLAATLVAKEIAAIRPSFVLMNGVANARQPLWIELGAMNQAAPLPDGTNVLAPALPPGGEGAKLVEGASASELALGNRLSWTAVQAAARGAIQAHATEVDGDVTFGDVVSDAVFAGFPRAWNTYLCNNVTYVTGWLMTHPGRAVPLLRASTPAPNAPSDVSVRLEANLSAVPRVFIHWPSDLADRHHEAAADVMKAIIAAQLRASRDGDSPVLGDTALADPSLAADPPAAP
jgi:hypothetical protein